VTKTSEAFTDLVNNYLRPVYNFAYRLTGSKEDAADIAQDTFLKAWKNAKEINSERNVKAWLFTIAKNCAVDLARKNKTVPFSDIVNENEELIENILIGNGPTPEESLIQKYEAEPLLKAVSALSPIYREILTLRYDEDLSFEEIAGILGISPNTVRSRHRRAILALKPALAPK